MESEFTATSGTTVFGLHTSIGEGQRYRSLRKKYGERSMNWTTRG